jgi:hypothetical protein
MSAEVIDEISVCLACMFMHTNGEYPGGPADIDPNEPEPWALLPEGTHPAMGGEHNERCTPADREEGCDCENLGFSWSRCEGCGSTLGGDRYLFTLFAN